MLDDDFIVDFGNVDQSSLLAPGRIGMTGMRYCRNYRSEGNRKYT